MNIKEDLSWIGEIKVKCIIPKGSQYYKGKFLGMVGYAITYVEI